MDKIVISGMGIVSALGCTKTATLHALQNGISGISSVKHLMTKHRNLPLGEVDLSEEEMRNMLSISPRCVITRTALLGRIALLEALEQSHILPDNPYRIAFISGTTVGGMEKSEQYYLDFLNNDHHREYIPAHDCGANTDSIAQAYGGRFDMMTTISTACSSASNAIILGANLIKTQRADIVIAGGSECLSKFHVNGFDTLRILDAQPCKPFDARRNGINLGEGAAYLVLETATIARKRGVEPLCFLSGYANMCDAYHQTASSPEGEGAYLSMTKALQNSGLSANQIDYINAHGTGTPNNDLTEGIAIERVFGSRIPLISSTKSFTGHTTSAAGAVEAVISILALTNGFIPDNLNFAQPMSELSFKPVDKVIYQNLNHVLSNSFAFGGNDSSLIFSHHPNGAQNTEKGERRHETRDTRHETRDTQMNTYNNIDMKIRENIKERLTTE